MVCYAVSLAAFLFVHFAGKNKSSDKNLELMLAGGAVFGVVDHVWNGQLFLISENLFWDLALGVVIVASIFLFWSLSKTLNFFSSRERELSEEREHVANQQAENQSS
ncbi:hypothetical protein HY992_00875 [Candidatus Micrarchaeota archaeon]|nr:hypothetical protein [Candidatus Micrarchaeota archaeon]